MVEWAERDVFRRRYALGLLDCLRRTRYPDLRFRLVGSQDLGSDLDIQLAAAGTDNDLHAFSDFYQYSRHFLPADLDLHLFVEDFTFPIAPDSDRQDLAALLKLRRYARADEWASLPVTALYQEADFLHIQLKKLLRYSFINTKKINDLTAEQQRYYDKMQYLRRLQREGRATAQLEQAQLEALYFAPQAYYSAGAMRHIVWRLPLSRRDAWQSAVEHIGDILRDDRADLSDGEWFIRSSKAALRLLEVASMLGLQELSSYALILEEWRALRREPWAGGAAREAMSLDLARAAGWHSRAAYRAHWWAVLQRICT